jgi:hypothetical protein
MPPTTQEAIKQVGEASDVVGKGPLAVAIVIFIVAFGFLLYIYTRSKDREVAALELLLEKGRTASEADRREAAQALEKLRHEYAQEMKTVYREEQAIRIRLEVALIGLTELIRRHFQPPPAPEPKARAQKAPKRRDELDVPILGLESRTEIIKP